MGILKKPFLRFGFGLLDWIQREGLWPTLIQCYLVDTHTHTHTRKTGKEEEEKEKDIVNNKKILFPAYLLLSRYYSKGSLKPQNQLVSVFLNSFLTWGHWGTKKWLTSGHLAGAWWGGAKGLCPGLWAQGVRSWPWLRTTVFAFLPSLPYYSGYPSCTYRSSWWGK